MAIFVGMVYGYFNLVNSIKIGYIGCLLLDEHNLA